MKHAMIVVLILLFAVAAASGQVLFFDDLEVQDASAWTNGTNITAASSGAVQSSVVHSGTWAWSATIGANATAQKSYLTTNFSAAGISPAYARFYFRFDGGWAQPLGSSGDTEIAEIVGITTGTDRLYLRHETGTSHWHLRDYYGLALGTTLLAPDTWYGVEVKIEAGTGSARVTVYLNGTQETISDGTQTFSNLYQAKIGVVATTTGSNAAGVMYFDDVAIGSAQIGSPAAAITVRRPNTAARSGLPVDVTMFGQVASDRLIAVLNGSTVFDQTGSITGHMRFPVSIASLSTGDYTFSVTLKDSGGTDKATFSETWHKYRAGTPTVSIDENNRISIGASKQFLLTPYMEDCANHPCQFDNWWPSRTIQNGWNSGYSSTGYSIAQYQGYIDNLNPAGGGVATIGPNTRIGPITVWSSDVQGVDCTVLANQNISPCFTVNQPEAPTLVANYVTALGSDSNVLGWTWADEPDTGTSPGRVNAVTLGTLTAASHDNDADHPVFSNFYGYSPYTTRRFGMLYPIVPANAMVADVVSQDMYPYVYHNANYNTNGVKIKTVGSGYAVGDAGFLVGGNSDATYQVISVSGGAVQNFVMTNRGTGYSAADPVNTTATSGGGSGLQFKIVSVSGGVITQGQMVQAYNGSYPLTIATWLELLDTWHRYTYDLTPMTTVIECGKQNGGSTTNTGPMPNQLSMETWLAVIHGVQGITWWGPEAFTNTSLTAATMESIRSNIAALNGVLTSTSTRTVTSNRSVAGSRADASVRETGGNVWVLAARVTDDLTDPVEATASSLATQFTVSGLTGSATVTVYGESRTFTATNGVFSDSLAPYDVHIYQFGGAAATGSVMYGTFSGTIK